jgi:L-cysteine S-thiosulfotransferase
MVRQHYVRNVWLVACALPWLCVAGYGAETDRARAIISNPQKGNCIICHFIPLAGVPSNAFGNLGPSLAGVGSRLTRAQIKSRIADPRVLLPETVMPAYGSTKGLYRVASAYRSRPILTDAEIETLVAYLCTLK